MEYFSNAGFDMDRICIKRNAPVALLYEDAIRNEGAIISSTGALINFSGKKIAMFPTPLWPEKLFAPSESIWL